MPGGQKNKLIIFTPYSECLEFEKVVKAVRTETIVCFVQLVYQWRWVVSLSIAGIRVIILYTFVRVHMWDVI